MARRRVLKQMNLGGEMEKPACKYHEEREAVLDCHGRSTGMCRECLSSFGKRGAAEKWQKQPEESPANSKYDALAALPERLAEAVMELARPGAEQKVLALMVGEIKMRAAALLGIMAK